MDYSALLNGRQDCPCGKIHLCPIDHVHIGPDAISRLSGMVQSYQHILLVADENTYRVQGGAVASALGLKCQDSLIYPGEQILVPDEKAIDRLFTRVTEQTDLIIGVGSGVINDLCKHVSYQRDLPYYIVATAPSMDGYASNGAALILNGMKISPNARPPKAIFADTAVLAQAPMEMLQAGYGDIMGKLSCLNDWKLSALINGEYFCDYVHDLTMQTVLRLQPLAERIRRREEAAIGVLMEALVTVGIAMSYVGNSRPASGSEHHLSHFFEITGIVHGRPYYPHGIDVAYASIVTAGLREQLFACIPEEQPFNRTAWENEIRRIYGSAAQGVIDLQDKLDSYHVFSDAVRFTDWQAIRCCLSEAPSKAQMQQIIESVGLRFADFEAFYGEDVLNDAICYGKDLKDRYTVLWLYNQFLGCNFI